MTIKHILTFLLLTLTLPIFAQQQVEIIGTVSGEYDQALEFVTISQVDTFNSTQTDEKGNYSLFVAKGVPIKIVFSYVGYKNKQISIPNVNTNSRLDIKLVKSDAALPEVIVEGKTMTTLRESLNFLGEQRPSSPTIDGGIEGLLVTMGGVSSSNELSSQYSVRGGNFDENMVYVNGIEIYRPFLVRNAQQEGLSFINPSMVKTIDFSAGGFTSEYGDKMSSVLDVGYKKPTKFEGSATASMLGGNIYLGSSSKAFSQVTGIRYKTTRSLLSTTDTDAEYDPNFIDAQTYMALNLSKDWEVSFLGNYAHNEYKFTPKTRETKFGTIQNVRNFKVYFDGWENDKFITHQAALSLKGKVSESVTLKISGSLFGSDEYERYDINSRYVLREMTTGNEGQDIPDDNSLIGLGSYHEHARNDLNSKIYTFSHTGDAKFGHNELRWGVTYQQEKIEDKISEWEMRDSIGFSQPQGGDLFNIYSNLKSNNKIESSRFSGFLQDTYKIHASSGLFILNLGVRASHWDFNKETIISPRGTIAFIPEKNDNVVFRFSSGLYYQSPLYKEMQLIKKQEENSIIELNRDIRSQKSIHFVLGSDLHFKSGDSPFKFTSEIYYKKLSDLIPYTVNNVKIRYDGENRAKGYVAGIDLKLFGEFVPGTDSWVSLSLMKTEQNIDGIKVPLPSDQRYNLSMFFQDYFPGYERLTMSIKGVFSDGLPFTAPHKTFEEGYLRTPAYKRFDIGFAWQILGEDYAIRNRSGFVGAFKDVWLGLDAFNIFDIKNTNTHYWISDAYNYQYAVPNYLTGRQISAKLIVNF